MSFVMKLHSHNPLSKHKKNALTYYLTSYFNDLYHVLALSINCALPRAVLEILGLPGRASAGVTLTASRCPRDLGPAWPR